MNKESLMQRKIYSKSFKENSVRLMSERIDILSLTRELGVTTRLLYQWRKYFSAKGADSFSGKGNSIQSEEVKELQRLKRTNSRLEKENEILKKALGSISQGDI